MGLPPFYSKNQKSMLMMIIKEDFKFPDSVKASPEAVHLIREVTLYSNSLLIYLAIEEKT